MKVRISDFGRLSIFLIPSAFFMVSSFADVVLPPQRPSTRWVPEGPTLIKKSNGCERANVCLGSYERLAYGFHGEVAVIGRGHAFCNSTSDGRCPTSDACIADEDMTVKFGATVVDSRPGSRGSNNGAVNSGANGN